MMAVVFAAMTFALIAVRYGRRWLGILSLMICLVLALGLFLFEIYSPEYGFRMPWLQVQIEAPDIPLQGGHA